MKLTEEDKVKLRSYLKTKVGRPDRLVGELRELLKEKAKNKDGKFMGEDAIRNLLGSKEVVVESSYLDTLWDVPSKEEILAQL